MGMQLMRGSRALIISQGGWGGVLWRLNQSTQLSYPRYLLFTSRHTSYHFYKRIVIIFQVWYCYLLYCTDLADSRHQVLCTDIWNSQLHHGETQWGCEYNHSQSKIIISGCVELWVLEPMQLLLFCLILKTLAPAQRMPLRQLFPSRD